MCFDLLLDLLLGKGGKRWTFNFIFFSLTQKGQATERDIMPGETVWFWQSFGRENAIDM